MTGWFLRSMSDGDTHRGIYSPATRSVHARCGIEFQPLKKTNGCTDRAGARPAGPDLPRLPWWCPVSDPRTYLDQLAAMVALRHIIVLADLAPTLTDAELADRLLTLAGWLR